MHINIQNIHRLESDSLNFMIIKTIGGNTKVNPNIITIKKKDNHFGDPS